MGYEVTATRRRPQSFNELIGQDFVASTLENAIQTGKIAHAYLFSGPRGCGKTTSARILAKMLNCVSGPSSHPCGTCPSCLEITRGASIDVIEIDGASNTSVNDIRQIKDEVLFPPNSYRYKIYIIDEVHMLSTSAFNALLKTIEEPPPYVVFIFATTELHKVPATIKSRCQQFHFRLGNVEQIKNMLALAAKEINIEADDEALYWIAKESTGSFRDAYTLFDQVAAFSDSHITYEKIRDKLGLVGVETLNLLCETCVDGDTQKAFLILDEALQKGISIEQFITNLTEYFRNILFLLNGIEKESLLSFSAERFSQKVLAAWNPIQVERALSLFLQLFRDVRYSVNPRIELELAISRLCWLSSFVSYPELKETILQARNILIGKSGENSDTNQGQSPFQNFLDTIKEKKTQSENSVKNTYQSVNAVSRDISLQAQKESPTLIQNKPAFIINDNEKPLTTEKSEAQVATTQEEFITDIDLLRDGIIAELKPISPQIGIFVENSTDWNITDSVLSFMVKNAFEKNQILAQTKILSKIVLQLYGKYLSIQPKIFVKEEKNEDKVEINYPPMINLLTKNFDATSVSVTEAQNFAVLQNKKTENEDETEL
ncbi:MAG: DNA polymerase III subunit gamma/tau [Spirochaetaceae bacterium]|nr:DNA polymerase III subunit gamma/tau [Spirochaetaceae bacterium]